MIVREILETENLTDFDYFNDYRDTFDWLLVKLKYSKTIDENNCTSELMRKLNKGHGEWLQDRYGKYI